MFFLMFYLVIRVSVTVSEFRVYPDQTVPVWTTYFSLDPNDEGLLQHFPAIFGLTNDNDVPIGPAVNLTVTTFEREALELGGSENYYFPGVNIAFYPPETGHITGYEITLHSNRLRAVCIVMDFTDRNWDHYRQIEQELFPLQGLDHYQLTVTSLPMYDQTQRSKVTDFVSSVYNDFKMKGAELPPSAEWYASIQYYIIGEVSENDTRSIEVVFERPPSIYEFRRFEVALLPKGGNSEIRKARTSELYYLFEEVSVGNYRIMMWPVDEYFSQADRCLCRLRDGACANCVSTVVDNVIVTP